MDGLELRTATEADAEQIIALSTQEFGADIGVIVRAELDDPERGPGIFTVVTDRDQVVSSLCLLDERVRVGGIELPVGQVEYVVTLAQYRRRGLVRAQFARVHELSAQRGDALTVVGGIPYFYRRLGYEYAIGLPPSYIPGWGAAAPMPEGWQVRTATEDDIDVLARLHERMQAVSDLVSVRRRQVWPLLLGSSEQQLWVGVHEGAVRASAQVWTHDGKHWMLKPAAEDLDGARALFSAALERLPRGAVSFSDRPGTPWSALLHDLGVPIERRYAVYVRVPDVVDLLNRLRPVLSRRLAASPYRDDSGVLEISFYAFGVALDYAGGAVTAMRRTDGAEDPDDGEVSVPPDLAATLILGRYGAGELARRHDDMSLGRRGSLMATLFPRLRSDVSF